MNAFEKHGVYHLSPSRINKWIEQPALCLVEIAGVRDSAGPAAWRGTATDKAVTKAGLEKNHNLDQLIAFAESVFDGEHANSLNKANEAKIEKERKALSDYVTQGVQWVSTISQIESAQGHVTVELPDVPVPIHGYFDLLTANEVRDMKTGMTAPTEIKAKHGRQMAIYAKATNREPWIDFITKKGVRSFKVENLAYWELNFALAAKSLERTLSFSDDIFECCQLVFPDFDGPAGWMWSDVTKKAAIDIWNMEGLTDVY